MKQHPFSVIVEEFFLVRVDDENDLLLEKIAHTIDEHEEPYLEEKSQAEAW